MDKSKTAILPFTGEDSLESLKKSALLVDKLILAFITSKPRARRARFPLSRAYYSDEQIERVATELTWLFDKGLLEAPAKDPSSTGFEMEDFDPDLPVCVIRTAKSTCYFTLGSDSIDQALIDITAEKLLVEPESLPPPLQSELIYNPLHNIPIILSNKALNQYQSEKTIVSPRNYVLDVVLNNVPQPTVDTPWDAIIDWRCDEEAQVKFRRLTNWMNKAAERKDLNPVHLRDEVAYLLDEYILYMRIQKTKFSTGTLRTIITSTAEIIESVIKLKLKTLADMPFKIKELEIAAQEAEVKAPGRDLVYIIDTSKRFAKK